MCPYTFYTIVVHTTLLYNRVNKYTQCITKARLYWQFLLFCIGETYWWRFERAQLRILSNCGGKRESYLSSIHYATFFLLLLLECICTQCVVWFRFFLHLKILVLGPKVLVFRSNLCVHIFICIWSFCLMYRIHCQILRVLLIESMSYCTMVLVIIV